MGAILALILRNKWFLAGILLVLGFFLTGAYAKDRDPYGMESCHSLRGLKNPRIMTCQSKKTVCYLSGMSGISCLYKREKPKLRTKKSNIHT